MIHNTHTFFTVFNTTSFSVSPFAEIHRNSQTYLESHKRLYNSQQVLNRVSVFYRGHANKFQAAYSSGQA